MGAGRRARAAAVQRAALGHDRRGARDRVGPVEVVDRARERRAARACPCGRTSATAPARSRPARPAAGAISTMRRAHLAQACRAARCGRAPRESARRIFQSSLASPGGNTASRRALRPALGVDVGRVLLGVGGARQDHVGARARRDRRDGPGRSTKASPSASRSISSAPSRNSDLELALAGRLRACRRRRRPPLPGTRPRSRPPTRAAAVCSTLKPFQPSLTMPKRSASSRRGGEDGGAVGARRARPAPRISIGRSACSQARPRTRGCRRRARRGSAGRRRAPSTG